VAGREDRRKKLLPREARSRPPKKRLLKAAGRGFLLAGPCGREEEGGSSTNSSRKVFPIREGVREGRAYSSGEGELRGKALCLKRDRFWKKKGPTGKPMSAL